MTSYGDMLGWEQFQDDLPPTIMSLLRLADEGDERIRTTVADPAHVTYLVNLESQVVGVVTMRWDAPDSEIIYLAVAPDQQGKGYGKIIVQRIIAQANDRHIQRILVGTGNASLENLAFYQKCGFRMDHIRRDYYDYIQPPISENGIPLRDMVVFSLAVDQADYRSIIG